ncbi:MAG: type I DNA topoisomerase [Anaerolineae bacterium]|jgi:DNA topoisomerase-1
MEAYCLKCRAKREIENPEPVFTNSGAPATKGICPECGTKLFRMGRTPAHDGLDPEEHTVMSKARARREKQPGMVIVESPAKARTVDRFLGDRYNVRASVGHVRDLPSNRMGVDLRHDFRPQYVVPSKRKDVVSELKDAVKESSELYLATDPDREGEAISWHLLQVLDPVIRWRPVHRVEFHQITEEAIEHAFAHPREIDMQRVEAQQARRILDRIVGYTISPLLREKLGRRGLSAGRVQSVALRLVVERERAIKGFVPLEYWSLEAELAKKGKPDADYPATFIARLHRIAGEDVELSVQDDVRPVIEDLERSSYVVASVQEGQRRRGPKPPFTTSTMQQQASYKLGFTTGRTMAAAQQLYEGLDLGDGPVGLITYMRTDSTEVAREAQAEAQAYIIEQHGEEYLPPKPPHYKTKAKAAQEAHEAIRPTSVFRTPSSLKKVLDRTKLQLYELIWRRFVASQMARAVYDTIAAEILAGPADQEEKPYLFRATGSTLRFPGFLVVYEEEIGEGEESEKEGKREEIPPLTVGELLDLVDLLPNQHFTKAPPRYSEASLVRDLEEYGIGRPSTYAPILSKIQERGYVERRRKRLYATEIGMIVNDLLVEYFPDYVDLGFTAQMEDDLDLIASGERDWIPVLRNFYGPFARTLTRAGDRMPKLDINNRPTGEMCPKCGNPLVYRYGRYGKFIGCSSFPDCRFSKAILVKTGARCPECGGDLVERRSRRGRTFYGCSKYDSGDSDSCDFAVWKQPLPQPCPECGGLLTEVRQGWAKCRECKSEFELADLPEDVEATVA